MGIKLYILYFMMYLLITSNSIFLYETNLFSMTTSPKLTGNKLCLIVVDGLRYDAVKDMPFISHMTKNNNGILYSAYSGIPSNSRPGYERIFTGTSSDINGFDSNKMHLPSFTPNIFSLLKHNHLSSCVLGYYWIKELYPVQIDHGHYYFSSDRFIFRKAASFIKLYKPDFLVIHPMEVDIAGHKYGGTSVEYVKASMYIDSEIKNIWSFLEESGYSLIVISDHGHKAAGGHGDNSTDSTKIPIAVISSNLSSLNLENSESKKDATDIAPTICDILGLSKTIYMTGNSLVKGDSKICSIRKAFSLVKAGDFKKFFSISFKITHLIICAYTIIYLANYFIAVKLLKKLS